VPRAIEGGIGSILSSPLLADTGSVGALNIYSNTERAFGPQQQEVAALIATEASNLVVQARSDVGADTRLQGALEGREVIAQAQGVLMVVEGLSGVGAFAHLRRGSREEDVPLRQYAEAILARIGRDEPTGPASGG